jgi:thioredoxin 1
MARIAAYPDIVVLSLWAEWHNEGKKLHTRLPLVAIEHQNALFIEVDLSDNKEIADAVDIETVPEVRFYREGRVVEKIVGYDINGVQETLLQFAKV